jgi:putative ABC transport system permease protein
MDRFITDLRHAIRVSVRNPLFTLAVLLSLGPGIGLNAAVFSFVNAVLLQPFPYKDPDRLALIWGTKSFEVQRGLRGEDLENWGEQSHDIQDLAVFQINTFPFSIGADGAHSIRGAMVGTRTFSLLGVSAVVGRTFSEIEEEPGNEKNVVLSYGLWQSRFGRDTGVVGKSIQMNGELHTIVGVMPAEFFFPDQNVQVWVPLTRSTQMFEQVHGLVRLRPGATLGQAQVELDTLSRRVQKRGVGSPSELNPGIFSLYRVVVGKYETALWTLLAAVAVLLLIACANTSSLMLARGIGREKEFAMRVSFGGSRSRIFWLLLTENVFLSLSAGVFGILLGYWGVLSLRSLRLADIQRFDLARMDPKVLLFSLGISLLAGVLSGLVPALKCSQSDLLPALQAGGASTHPRRHGQIRNLLVTIEVAVAVILLIASGLLISSFMRLAHASWGFDSDHLLIVEATIPELRGRISPRQIEFATEVLEQLPRVPEVTSSAMAYGLPIKYGWKSTRFAVDGRMIDWKAGSWIISPRYFRTLAVPVLSGREFERRDDQLASRSVVISKEFAQRLWPGKDPIGKKVEILKLRKDLQDKVRMNPTILDSATERSPASWEPDGPPWVVIGEVGNVRMFGLDLDPDPALYIDYRQQNWFAAGNEKFVLRTSADPLKIASAVTGQIVAAQKAASIVDVSAMSDLVSQSIGGRGSNKLMLVISILFGGLSLSLAAAGIYAVVSFSVLQRAREIGVRRALGAQSADIFRLVLNQGMRPVLPGLLLGLVGALMLSGVLNGLLFGVTPTDPGTFLSISILLLLVSGAACFISALRALRVNPAEALHYE